MVFDIIFFFLCQVSLLLTGLGVIGTRNPIYAIFFFILVIINLSICLLLLSAEFLGFIFIVVYVGAICILFLFIVLLLDIRTIELGGGVLNYISASIVIMVSLLIELLLSLRNGNYLNNTLSNIKIISIEQWVETVHAIWNITTFGEFLYLYNFHVVVLVSLVLLIAMIGCVVITLEYRILLSSPVVAQQISRVANLRFLY